jgi:hypothetical protein
MCVVSMVIDGANRQWGNIQTWPSPVPQDMSEIIRRLAEIDKKLGAKDCFDPKKDEFIRALQDRIAELESKPKARKKKST